MSDGATGVAAVDGRGAETCPVARARGRVTEELERTREKRRALDRFESAVESIAVTSPTRQVTTEGFAATQSSGTTGVRRVREAFEEHVRPLSGDALETPETVHEAIATEFSRDVAVALATAESGGLPSRLKRAVLDESARRRGEMKLTARALDGECESLDEARETLDEVRAWLDERDDVRLSTRDFGTLVAWHDRLDEHRAALDEVAERRQQYLDRTTATDITVAVSHRTLVEYLYAESPSTFPVLDACASLAATCATARRNVRQHLTGRA
ncbi:DUF7260 family protein [Salinigranum sp. GCM10025319]|uniref:DUF7260 family protein n=1 Tax=Salinigranum sp. GCM10025319 TaxID=3252687 RepID=UPI0036161F8C